MQDIRGSPLKIVIKDENGKERTKSGNLKNGGAKSEEGAGPGASDKAPAKKV